MSEHTPGPWTARGSMIYSAPSDTRWPDPLAQAFGHHSEENARQIAALPRLLAACKALMEAGPAVGDEHFAALAEAILEAEGGAS